jgi:hypothetical protein
MIQFKPRYFPRKERFKWFILLRWLWIVMMVGLALFLYHFVRIIQK